MEQNYYEILEVSKNASPEIIEKAYKTLVKKYHPDLQINEQKIKYEEKIKKINEAYDILSDSNKRKNYDINLKNTEISINDYNILYQENLNLKNNLNLLKQKLNYLNNTQNNSLKNNLSHYSNLNNNKNSYKFSTITNNPKNSNTNNYNHNSTYSNNLFNIKNVSKDLIALLLTILMMFFIGFILWHIPFTQKHLMHLYNNSFAFRFIINLFSNIFK